MNSAPITIPDDLDEELDNLVRDRNLPRSEVVEAALRRCLAEVRQQAPAAEDDFKPFCVPVLQERDKFGELDVSINHDYYLAEELYRRKFSDR
jgi:metal-responsive CopG/Arc/MetJ family transcriptional regulator